MGYAYLAGLSLEQVELTCVQTSLGAQPTAEFLCTPAPLSPLSEPHNPREKVNVMHILFFPMEP